MPASFVRNGDVLEVNLSGCRGSEFGDTLEKVKEIPARRYDPQRKLWVIPAEPDLAERLVKGAGAVTDQEVYDWIEASNRQRQVELATRVPDDAKDKLWVPWAYERAPWQPEHVNDEKVVGLLDYQRAAVEFLYSAQRAILGDDMGLGKTLIALSTVEEYRLRNGDIDGPKLIVAPSSVKGAWVREIGRWLPDDTPVSLVDGKTPAARRKQLEFGITENAYTIVNWEQLRVKKEKRERTIRRRNGSTSKRRETVTVPKEPLFGETEWLAVLCDEIHKAKNRNAQQTQGLWLLQAPLMLGMTGTAVQNSPDELWPILAWLYPDEYHPRGARHKPGAMAYWSFRGEFCQEYEDHYGRAVVIGVKNPDALRFRLHGRLIRRTADILDLKGRKRIYYPVDLNPEQQKLYDQASEQMWIEIEQQAKAGDKDAKKLLEDPALIYKLPNGAARMVRQRQIIESPALLGGPDDSSILDDLVEKVSDSRPEPWVVFVAFKRTCDLIRDRLEAIGLTVGVYNGDVSPADRTKLEDAFQRGEVDVVVGTIDAMREGITLTKANRQFWCSRAFVPAWNDQGEARCDRKGQQRRVTIFIPQATDTVADGAIRKINNRKDGIVRAILPHQTHEEVNL